MDSIRRISLLIRKELLLEWRQKYALSGMLLYVFSTVFIVYLVFKRIGPEAWMALFWIIVLFATVNAIAKSYMQESSRRQLYYFTLASPGEFFISKVIYNTFLLLGLNALAFGLLTLVSLNPIKNMSLFIATLALGSLGFSLAFTFLSAISSKASNGSTLLALLGFPVVIPILIQVITLTARSLGTITDSTPRNDLLILVALNVVLFTAGLLLFPYIWRD